MENSPARPLPDHSHPTRRNLLKGGAAALALSSPLNHLLAATGEGSAIKAVLFDGFPIFDPRSVLAAANAAAPGSSDLGQAWFAKIFAYTWLRTVGGRYSDFLTVAEQALDHVVASRKLALSAGQKAELMGAWMQLKLWPDAAETLDVLSASGVRLAFLSNLSEEMLRTNARANGVEAAFDYLSTDRVGAFKPDPRAYQMGIDFYNLPKQSMAFCAFGGWDAVGASWFGYPTAWINRLNQQGEILDAPGPIIEGNSLAALLQLQSGG